MGNKSQLPPLAPKSDELGFRPVLHGFNFTLQTHQDYFDLTNYPDNNYGE